MSDFNENDKIDPDLFESLISVLGTLSSIGSFAIAWLQIRQDKAQERREIDRFQARTQINQLEGQFESLFRSLREITALFKSVEQRDKKFLSDIKLGFGRATYKFTNSEFSYYQNLMIQLNASYSNVSNSSLGLTQMFQHGRVSGEDAISDNLEDIHEKLNDILFSSANFDDAIIRLEELKRRVQEFLKQLESLGNS